MEYRANYTVIGFFVVLMSALLIIMGFWLTGGRHAKEYKTYLVYMNEAAYGLSESAPVKFSGVTVGYVGKIELNPHDLKQVRITVHIEETVPVTVTTVAQLQLQGITGISYIGLISKTRTAPLLAAKPGELYPVIPAIPSFLTQLVSTVTEVTSSLQSIGKNLNKVFDEENTVAIKKTMQSLATVTKTLANNSKEIDASLKSLNRLLVNTSKASEQFPLIISKTRNTLESVQKLTGELGQASHEFKSTMKTGRAAIKNFSDQALPSVVRASKHLERIASNVDAFTKDLRHNPSMLVRGKQPAAPGPGER